ncbi:MAG: hypothetical protein K0S71_1750 [Clostridia bacterium]|nr:hypothetical protein [Clostridia bacterium]
MNNITSIILIFPLAITLHNLEEALWLPQWSRFAKQYHKPIDKNEFYFALICVTLLAYLSSIFFLFFNEVVILKYIYFGFVGMMILNAIFPHLIATIVLKRYAPGVITGIFMNVPCFSFLITFAIKENVISPFEVIISTAIVGGIILALLPIFFELGRRLIMFEED